MDVTIAGGALESLRTGLAVIPTYAGPGIGLSGTALALDRHAGGVLARLVAAGDLGGEPGDILLVPELSGVLAERVLLVSLGQPDTFDDRAFRIALRRAAEAIAASPARDAAVAIGDIEGPGRDREWLVQEATGLLAQAGYRFALRSLSNGGPRCGPGSVMLVLPGPLTGRLAAAHRRGLALSEGITLARDLGNLPGNLCTPAYLASVAQEMGEELALKVKVLERPDLEALGMGAFLAVGRASANPCRMIVLRHDGGAEDQPPVVLIGKAVTFDTGGVSLKPGAAMDEMKFDMSGGGAVLGVMRAVARLGLPLNVIAIVAAAENMPGGNASRPGDIVVSMSGRTVEILNTDAEGRLLLCDALTFAERFAPAAVVDVATLTGACVVALGRHAHGLFANDDNLAGALLASGYATGDRAWRMPVWDDYLDQLKSNFADLSNLGGPSAGAVTAACFLSRFAQSYPWAHLDIAGTASLSGPEKGSTGRPVPLLTHFLMARAASA